MITAAHVVMRFQQYAAYPARVVIVSKRFNPDGFRQEILRFLAAPGSALDTGYSDLLRKEAL
eukprot:4476090-Alexandrium_andersonii.AAC.1